MDFPGEKLLIHFLDMVERNALSPFVGPWKARRDGFAALEVQRAQMLMIAQAENDISRIKSGELIFSQSEADLGLPKLVQAPLASDEEQVSKGSISGVLSSQSAGAFTNSAIHTLRREVNIAKAVARAGSVLLEDEGVAPEQDPDPDWLERWRENAGGVSAEKMQELWAQVLAREVRTPGSLSLKAMDLLRNLDSNDAALIERLAAFAIDRTLVHRGSGADTKDWLKFGDALALQELGILAGVEAFGMSMTLASSSGTEFVGGLRVGRWGLGLRGSDPNTVVRLDGYKVTSVGQEILLLVDADPDRAYLEEVAAAIKALGVTVELGIAVPIDGGNRFQLEGALPL